MTTESDASGSAEVLTYDGNGTLVKEKETIPLNCPDIVIGGAEEAG